MMLQPVDPSKIHLFNIRNKKFVLDVNSAIFFEINDLVYSILERLDAESDVAQIIGELSRKYPREEIAAGLKEVAKLINSNNLFSEDRFRRSKSARDVPLSFICLNISHDCNLRCAYCFANREGYNYDRQLMSIETAERSVDFLISNSEDNRDLEISFFGGEPLMNIPVLIHTVKYARKQGIDHDKFISFHITTNGTLLSPEIIKFLRDNNFSIIVSLDGPKDVQDSMRCFPDGSGSYDLVLNNLKLLLSERKGFRNISIRSTFTNNNLDIENLMMHLAELGCHNISVEPAYTGNESIDIDKSSLEELLLHYDLLAFQYLGEMAEGRYFSFFHIKQMMNRCHHRNLRVAQCGASAAYLSISVDGKIYSCHRFIGQPEFVMGDVYTGLIDNGIKDMFINASIHNKSKCMICWARYICGGGCHYIAIKYNKDILDPYDIECEMIKRRIELGVYLYSTLKDINPLMHRTLYGETIKC